MTNMSDPLDSELGTQLIQSLANLELQRRIGRIAEHIARQHGQSGDEDIASMASTMAEFSQAVAETHPDEHGDERWAAFRLGLDVSGVTPVMIAHRADELGLDDPEGLGLSPWNHEHDLPQWAVDGRKMPSNEAFDRLDDAGKLADLLEQGRKLEEMKRARDEQH